MSDHPAPDHPASDHPAQADPDLARPLPPAVEPDELLVAGFVAAHAALHQREELDQSLVLWLLGPEGALVALMANHAGWPVPASIVPMLAAEVFHQGATSIVATLHLEGARRPHAALARAAHRFGRAMAAARVPVRAIARVDVPTTFLPPWSSRGGPP